MKVSFKKSKLFYLISLSLLVTCTEANASMLGMCDDTKKTQYICCPPNESSMDAKWIVSSSCDVGAKTFCINDTGPIAGRTPPISILDDCKMRGGSHMDYYISLSNKKHK